jgi:hypothetical protein
VSLDGGATKAAQYVVEICDPIGNPAPESR